MNQHYLKAEKCWLALYLNDHYTITNKISPHALMVSVELLQLQETPDCQVFACVLYSRYLIMPWNSAIWFVSGRYSKSLRILFWLFRIPPGLFRFLHQAITIHSRANEPQCCPMTLTLALTETCKISTWSNHANTTSLADVGNVLKIGDRYSSVLENYTSIPDCASFNLKSWQKRVENQYLISAH